MILYSKFTQRLGCIQLEELVQSISPHPIAIGFNEPPCTACPDEIGKTRTLVGVRASPCQRLLMGWVT